MKKILLSLFILIAALLCVVTGAIIGVGYYQAGYLEGATDEQSCYETEGEPCEGYYEQLVPA